MYWHGFESVSEFVEARAQGRQRERAPTAKGLGHRVCRRPRFLNAITGRDDAPGQICGRRAQAWKQGEAVCREHAR